MSYRWNCVNCPIIDVLSVEVSLIGTMIMLWNAGAVMQLNTPDVIFRIHNYK